MITLSLTYHAFDGNSLRRSLFVATFKGTDKSFTTRVLRLAGSRPNWQEQIHNGDWHNVVNRGVQDGLEATYQRFIVNNPDTFETGKRLNNN